MSFSLFQVKIEHMKSYKPSQIEKKWQRVWEKKRLFEVKENPAKKKDKEYILNMFPYPSASGLHVGHVLGWTASDVLVNYERMKGKHILYPIGFDAFGLPAENYAIKTKIHPAKTTKDATKNFTRQLKVLGISCDWSRVISTSEPDYYKWTQWLFLLLYKMGLAYKKYAPVNWCNSCQTVLAREQVVNGKCERCKKEVTQKELEQWFFKITKYADRLLNDLEKLDWPESIKEAQRNWIGRKEGINITYNVVDAKGKEVKTKDNTPFTVTCFTTRPDTNFGATFVVLAPEHEFVKKITRGEIHATSAKKQAIEDYIQKSQRKSETERIAEGREKTGVATGYYCLNQLTNYKMPLYISDFVLGHFGTGAVVGVPGHDKRDFEFAKKFKLPVIRVVVAKDGKTSPITKIEEVQEEEGIMINSDFLNGLDIREATQRIMDHLEKNGYGKKTRNYRLRDWLVSRQRYWGAPIPIIYCPKCGMIPVKEKDLPVKLPTDVDFLPHGESPLAKSKSFHRTVCPTCGERKGVRRESDTMDTFVDSSWYFLRYTDPKNEKRFADEKKIHYWNPVDWYVGGAEHAVLHLLYARFFTKVLHDAGLVKFEEPFMKLRTHGVILGEDGQKMSKSIGNVINPDEVVSKFGADVTRMYEMFMGPFEDTKPWSSQSILGVYRFLDRVWKMGQQISLGKSKNAKKELRPLVHQTIKKVEEDIEEFHFNTCVSQCMIVLNSFEKETPNKKEWEAFLQVLCPFAPHITEELWSLLGNKKSIRQSMWPVFDPTKILEERIVIVVQVNGKVRGQLEVHRNMIDKELEKEALALPKLQTYIGSNSVKKVIVVPNRLINFVV